MTNREICERLLEIHTLVNPGQGRNLLRLLLLDLAAPEPEAPKAEDLLNLPKTNPCDGSPDDIVPDGIGGWRRRGDENITYTYGTGTNEAGK